MADGAADERGPYRVFLAQGTLYLTGMQLANVTVVLPFIAAEYNLLWVAGLVYAASAVGVALGNALSPFVLARSRSNVHAVIAWSTGAMAAAVALSALSAWSGLFVAAGFLSASLAAGLVSGLSKVAFSESISAKLTERRRRDLVLVQGALGAVTTVLITLLLVPYLTQTQARAGQVDLLWLGAVCLSASAVCAIFIGPVSLADRPREVTFADTYRQGLRAARSQRWFRRYAWIMVFFVPVSLGTPFYSVHASVNHPDTVGCLEVLIISSSVGLLVGAALWRWVSHRHGVRAMLVLCALQGVGAAAICVAIELRQEWDHVWVYSVVFVLATVANQGIFSAGLIWVSRQADEGHRAALLGFGALLIAVESSLVGAALGAYAQNTAIIGPLAALLTLNVLAVLAATVLVPDRRELPPVRV
ncbi:MAG: MFS transporter [Mycobacterium sp.]|nr:MFS transporter [Mycobacterium sp.]